MKKYFSVLALTTLSSVLLFAGTLEKGFDALKVFNYFEAKELFEKSIKSHPSGAAYGLSTIYLREDNPFHNLDSAYKYIIISDKSFKSTDAKEKEILLKLNINQPAINDHKEKIITAAFEKAKKDNSITAYTWFIKNIATAALKKEAIKRAEAELGIPVRASGEIIINIAFLKT